MKKMMIALVAMFVMTMSANAQSVNDSKLSFDKLSSYLDLRVDQVEQVKTAMAQFSASMEAYNQVKETPKAAQAWERIQAAHKSTMKKVLDEKQYQKYEQTLNLTIRNTAERLMEEATATRYPSFEFSSSWAKLRKVEHKTKKLVSFFVETE